VCPFGCPQFLANGCENCAFFGMDGDRVRVGDCTTPNFQSLLSVVDPASSWAAKWQHLSERLISLFCFLHILCFGVPSGAVRCGPRQQLGCQVAAPA
jgi:Spt4/RpoE2 zinc finger